MMGTILHFCVRCRLGLYFSIYIYCLGSWFPCTVSAQSEDQTDRLTLLRGALHVHSNFSCGMHSPQELVDMARKAGLDFIVITDHDQQRAEYGIFPFQRTIKVAKSRSCVFGHGMEKYFHTLEALDRKYNDIIVLGGVEVNTHYHWTGNPISGLTIHDFRKHILVLDLPTVEDYKFIPTLHNPHIRKIHKLRLPAFLGALFFFALGILNVKRRWILPRLRWTLAALLGLIAYNQHPVDSSPYHQYRDWGERPFQELIHYVNSKEGIALWAHPEGQYVPDKLDTHGVTVPMETYPQILEDTKEIPGFPSIYGETTTLEKVGGPWDAVLQDYILGKRNDSIYGFGEVDYNGQPDDTLDEIQTLVWVDEKTQRGVLDAIRTGRMAASRGERKGPIPILEFHIEDTAHRKKYNPGENIHLQGPPKIKVHVEMSDGFDEFFTIAIIKSGQIVHEAKGNLPLDVEWVDETFAGEPCYYRIEANGSYRALRCLSNPIFCNRK